MLLINHTYYNFKKSKHLLNQIVFFIGTENEASIGNLFHQILTFGVLKKDNKHMKLHLVY